MFAGRCPGFYHPMLPLTIQVILEPLGTTDSHGTRPAMLHVALYMG